jgi:hypothetical protein
MPALVLAKVVLAIVGVLFFLSGVRTDTEWLRWIGIALLAVGFLLRFVRRTSPGSGSQPPSGHS